MQTYVWLFGNEGTASEDLGDHANNTQKLLTSELVVPEKLHKTHINGDIC